MFEVLEKMDNIIILSKLMLGDFFFDGESKFR